jgi:NADH-ubiquinone oxidoreductase chain 3
MIVFFLLLTVGFIFELGKNALSIDSKQVHIFNFKEKPITDVYLRYLPK